MPRSHSKAAGSALLLVLWSLLLLSICVFGVVEIVQSSVTHASYLQSRSQAKALATSGLAVALHPQMKPGDSLLKQEPSPDQKWEVVIHGEAARLNLNYVLRCNHREILARLFVNWGMKDDAALALADCLYDWVTPGDKASPHGAKIADYQRAGLTHFPTGKPFSSFQEVSRVIGFAVLEKTKPDWADSFTLWSDGPLDINEAPPELLAAVFNLPLSELQSFVSRRNGKDGLPETDDDVELKDPAEVKKALGLGDKPYAAIANQISIADSVRRVLSTGRANGLAVTLSVVVRLQSSPPEYLLWNEL